MTRIETIGIASSTVLAAVILSVGSVTPVAAATQAVIEGPTAAALWHFSEVALHLVLIR
jgi:hypothetical protein